MNEKLVLSTYFSAHVRFMPDWRASVVTICCRMATSESGEATLDGPATGTETAVGAGVAGAAAVSGVLNAPYNNTQD